MNNRREIIKRIRQAGVLATVPGNLPLQEVLSVGDALLAAPVIGVEVMLQNGNGEALMADLIQRANGQMVVGAGGVETATSTSDCSRRSGQAVSAQTAIATGAQFISSPRLNFEIMAYCKEQDILYLPTVISLMAAQAVQQAGGDFVLLRTGGDDGSNYAAHILKTIPGLNIVATGDIDTRNIGLYAKAGVTAVITSNALTSGGNQTMANIISQARKLQKAWDRAKRKG